MMLRKLRNENATQRNDKCYGFSDQPLLKASSILKNFYFSLTLIKWRESRVSVEKGRLGVKVSLNFDGFHD